MLYKATIILAFSVDDMDAAASAETIWNLRDVLEAELKEKELREKTEKELKEKIEKELREEEWRKREKKFRERERVLL